MLEHVQIPARKPLVHLYGDGVQRDFSFDFPIFSADDLWVWINGQRQNGGYTVQGINQTAGGSVAFDRPPAYKSRITLHRQLKLERTSDFPADAVIRAKAMNDEFDYQAACLQQVQEQLDRCVKTGITDEVTANLTLPLPKAGAGLGWSTDGKSLVNDPADFAGTVAAAKASAAAAKASEAKAAASEANAKTSETNAKLSETQAAASEKVAATSASAAKADADRAHDRASSAETIYAALYPRLGPVERVRRDLLWQVAQMRYLRSLFHGGTSIPPSLEAELDDLRATIARLGTYDDFTGGYGSPSHP